jgi:hypothetical protein
MFLVIGWVLIKQGRRDQHRIAMLCAFGASTLFLAGYLVYHYHIGSKPYEGQGPIRVFYFVILISHIILAAFTLPLAIITLSQGPAGTMDPAPSHRAVDASDLALHVSHRSDRLPDAVSVPGVTYLTPRCRVQPLRLAFAPADSCRVVGDCAGR